VTIQLIAGSLRSYYSGQYGHADIVAVPSATNPAGYRGWGGDSSGSVTEGTSGDFGSAADIDATAASGGQNGTGSATIGGYESWLAAKWLLGRDPRKLVCEFMFKFGTVVTDSLCLIGLSVNNADRAAIKTTTFDAGVTYQFSFNRNGNTDNTGVTADTLWHHARIVLNKYTGVQTLSIDGGPELEQPIDTDRWPASFVARSNTQVVHNAWFMWWWE